jgi:hypothetical protein
MRGTSVVLAGVPVLALRRQPGEGPCIPALQLAHCAFADAVEKLFVFLRAFAVKKHAAVEAARAGFLLGRVGGERNERAMPTVDERSALSTRSDAFSRSETPLTRIMLAFTIPFDVAARTWLEADQ